MIKAIIFDIGGVVLLIKAEDIYKRFAYRLKISFDSFWEVYSNYKKGLLSGKVSAAEFSEILKKKFGLSSNVLVEWKNSIQDVIKFNEKTLDLIKSIKKTKKYKVAVVTNANEISFNPIRERGIYSLFDVAIVSCDVGFIKPERKIYELAIEKLKVRPDECVIMDDREELLEVPRKMGFHTILFKNNEQLAKDLKSLGVKF